MRAPTGMLAALVATGLLLGAAVAIDPFHHEEHSTLFVRCETCHLGAAAAGKPLWPQPVDCARCHDGTIEKAVPWTPRAGPLPSNLRFTHESHARAFTLEERRDTTLTCASCHSERGAKWMSVQRNVVDNCLACHEVRTAHVDAPPGACATCHVPFWEMPSGITAAQVATWKAPSSHDAPTFQAEHGDLAAPVVVKGVSYQVSPACATCHARDYCISCHVNAPDVPAIQALQPDPRSLAMAVPEMKAPASHSAPAFMTTHGRKLSKKQLTQQCGTCHTATSCEACHQVPPQQVRALAVAGPGRGAGATVVRTRPVTHGTDFTDGHATLANGSPNTCAGCHVQEQCLQCHRPNAGSQGTFHPADYISRHPVAAYSRETSCSECHNPGQFCQTCHLQNGVVSDGRFIGGQATYHDGNPTFAVGHGPAARQGLETCVSCHTEKDCLVCHASFGGRRFSPHGPDFPAEKLRKANPQPCLVCHRLGIPSN
jgi:hypothetical protein